MGNSNCDNCGNDKKMCVCPKDLYVAQVGGDHYQAQYQHWDWVIDMKMGYLEGNATKYVSRWWKKNGVQDLEKARTYVEKLIQNFGSVMNFSLHIHEDLRIQYVNRFVAANKLPSMEADFCQCMGDWRSKRDLQIALSLLDGLVTTAKTAPQGHPRPIAQPPATKASVDAFEARVEQARGLIGLDQPFGYNGEG